MRTTIAIDDDVLAAVKELAEVERKTIGEILSGLARRALRPEAQSFKMRNGVPLLPVKAGALRVTSELVRQFDEELQ